MKRKMMVNISIVDHCKWKCALTGLVDGMYLPDLKKKLPDFFKDLYLFGRWWITTIIMVNYTFIEVE